MDDWHAESVAGADDPAGSHENAGPGRSLGMWRVADSIDREIRKKSVVELVLEPDCLAVRLPDLTAVRVPYTVADYREPSDPRQAALYTAGGMVWVEPQDPAGLGRLKEGLALARPHPAPGALPLPWGSGDPPATLIWTYQATSLADATGLFQEEAATLSGPGYAPSAQSWAGSDRTGALVASLLGGATALFGILFLDVGTGILLLVVGVAIALIALAASPSGGSLTVTYAMRDLVGGSAPAAPSLAAAPAPSGEQAIRARLTNLDELHRDGLVTDDEYTARRSEILHEI